MSKESPNLTKERLSNKMARKMARQLLLALGEDPEEYGPNPMYSNIGQCGPGDGWWGRVEVMTWGGKVSVTLDLKSLTMEQALALANALREVGG